jgi:hypothetical protein
VLQLVKTWCVGPDGLIDFKITYDLFKAMLIFFIQVYHETFIFSFSGFFENKKYSLLGRKDEYFTDLTLSFRAWFQMMPQGGVIFSETLVET